MSSQKYEKFSRIFLLAGLLSLVVAILTLAILPATMVEDLGPQVGMPTEIPNDFKKYYSSLEEYHTALLHGRDVYISEACWHCHSQYVRPVSNEALRYGPVSQPGEYQNALNLPQLFGTRRVGPDLVREAGKRPNDWHFAHLFNPKWVEPESIMPRYSWYFDVKSKDGKPIQNLDAPDDNIIIEPKKEAVDLVAYLQWLGSEMMKDRYDGNTDDIIMPPTK